METSSQTEGIDKKAKTEKEKKWLSEFLVFLGFMFILFVVGNFLLFELIPFSAVSLLLLFFVYYLVKHEKLKFSEFMYVSGKYTYPLIFY